jgi:ABC-type methionine transport system ATPase subunit
MQHLPRRSVCSSPRCRRQCADRHAAVKIKKNIHFEFDQELVREPLLYKINRMFDVLVNIRGAQVSDKGGFIALELEGTMAEIDRVLDFLRGQGVRLGEGLGSSER